MIGRNRLIAAFGAYAVLAIVAVATLDDWRFRAGVLILLAGLALKSWVGERAKRS